MVPTGTDYQYTEVMTATPQKLQLMLIEAALRNASQARQHWASQQEARHHALIRSQSILTELLATLNPRCRRDPSTADRAFTASSTGR